MFNIWLCIGTAVVHTALETERRSAHTHEIVPSITSAVPLTTSGRHFLQEKQPPSESSSLETDLFNDGLFHFIMQNLVYQFASLRRAEAFDSTADSTGPPNPAYQPDVSTPKTDLLSLPNELIFLIINHLHSDGCLDVLRCKRPHRSCHHHPDLKNFSSTCRRLRQITGSSVFKTVHIRTIRRTAVYLNKALQGLASSPDILNCVREFSIDLWFHPSLWRPLQQEGAKRFSFQGLLQSTRWYRAISHDFPVLNLVTKPGQCSRQKVCLPYTNLHHIQCCPPHFHLLITAHSQHRIVK